MSKDLGREIVAALCEYAAGVLRNQPAGVQVRPSRRSRTPSEAKASPRIQQMACGYRAP